MMATTYVPIQSVTLASSAASVTFSSIPQTFTDLVIRVSTRTGAADKNDAIFIALNGSATNTSAMLLFAYGSTVSTMSQSAWGGGIYAGWADAATATSNTFASCEYYIPNYTSATYHPISGFSVSEDNSATGNYIGAIAGLSRVSAAITSVVINRNSSDFVAGSTFHLYGIKNS